MLEENDDSDHEHHAGWNSVRKEEVTFLQHELCLSKWRSAITKHHQETFQRKYKDRWDGGDTEQILRKKLLSKGRTRGKNT